MSKAVMDQTIAVGNTEGAHFSEAHFKRLREIAVVAYQAGATDFLLWYDAKEDFHHLAFTLDGDSYDLYYYKVFTLRKNPNTLKTVMGSGQRWGFDFHATGQWEVECFFRHGRYKEWK